MVFFSDFFSIFFSKNLRIKTKIYLEIFAKTVFAAKTAKQTLKTFFFQKELHVV